MSHTVRLPFRVVMVAAVLLGCRRSEREAAPWSSGLEAPATPPAAASPRAEVGKTPPPPAAASPELPPRDAGSPLGSGPVGEWPLGGWIDGNIYRIKIENLRHCRAPDGRRDAAAPGQLGIRVHIAARIDQLFVNAWDLTLENEGVIFQAQAVAVAPPGCAPALPHRQLRAGQSVAGFAVFQLPADFQADPRGPVLAFQPTRWGGGKRTELRLPPCLADCPKGGGQASPTTPTGAAAKGR